MSQQPPNDGQPPYDSRWGTGQTPPDQGYQQEQNDASIACHSIILLLKE